MSMILFNGWLFACVEWSRLCLLNSPWQQRGILCLPSIQQVWRAWLFLPVHHFVSELNLKLWSSVHLLSIYLIRLLLQNKYITCLFYSLSFTTCLHHDILLAVMAWAVVKIFRGDCRGHARSRMKLSWGERVSKQKLVERKFNKKQYLSDRKMKENSREYCPEWKKQNKTWQAVVSWRRKCIRQGCRVTERQPEIDRQSEGETVTEGEIDELCEDAESVPLSRLLPEANRQPLCCWNANATSCSSLVFPPFTSFL